MAQEEQADARWTVVLTTKQASRGKSRLAPYAGPLRADLARAMALDTIVAALRCRLVAGVVAVTSDPDSAALFSAAGATVMADRPARGLNAALAYGADQARRRRFGRPVAALQADLPALRADDLARALREGATHPNAFVSDSAGIGTTLYTAGHGVEFAPRFGADSRNAHRAAGAVELALPGLDSLRQDVDTEQDLKAAFELGLGPHTLAVLDALPKAFTA